MPTDIDGGDREDLPDLGSGFDDDTVWRFPRRTRTQGTFDPVIQETA